MNRRQLSRIPVDETSGELLDGEYQELPRNVVDDDYRRQLPQYTGLSEAAKDATTEEEAFNVFVETAVKATSYDGLPTEPLNKYMGKTIRVIGAAFVGVDSFRPKTIQGRENTEGLRVRGYDKLVLKVSHVSNKNGEMHQVPDDFIILETSAGQPMSVMRAAIEAGLIPLGDWVSWVDFKLQQVGKADKMSALPRQPLVKVTEEN